MPHNITAESLGLSIGTLVRVTREGRFYKAVTINGEDVTNKIASHTLKNAVRSNKALRLDETKTGGTRWSQVSPVDFDIQNRKQEMGEPEPAELNIATLADNSIGLTNHDDVVNYIQSSVKLKPAKIRISDVWWKFAVRNTVRGKNLLVVGPSGCGKTLLANALKLALNRQDKFFYINVGATQDPRSTLIGNTHYSPDTGTFVSLSYFAQAIQVPNALILLDEISRGHPDASNILMPVLDFTQRYLRVDEKADSETIRVADGVSFILTANVGAEYTGTRILDRALLDRCTMFEMQPLSEEDELENLRFSFPNVEEKYLKSIASIAAKTREEIRGDASKIDTIVSTRMAEEMASMIYDGFSLEEAAETCIYPYFSEAGGAESPRTFMKALVQKFIPTDFDGKKTVNRDKESNDDDKVNTPWG